MFSELGTCEPKYKCSVSKQYTAVVRFLSSIECLAPGPDLIMMFLKNLSRFAHLFSAEFAPASYNKIQSQIDRTPKIVLDFDGIVRD